MKYHKTKTTDYNILDRVEEWMDTDTEDIELYKYLGLTLEEYAVWLETGYLP
jgi:hypothetical protein